uniref:Protein FAR1-RELATED SEQUENCE n=1 Tax=Arundo donax TaxID=35708 RepID=A0A0A8ZYZ1_ARUDO
MEQIRRLAEWEVVEVAGDNGAVRYEVASKSRSNQRGPVTCTLDGALMVNVACHCQMLECDGIPCAHIFTILRSLNLNIIPPCCMSARWTMHVKSTFPSDGGCNTQEYSEQMERYRGLRNRGNLVLFKASRTAGGDREGVAFL